MKHSIKIFIGRKARRSGFGLWTSSIGLYYGGFKFYVFGIKGIISLTYRVDWGNYKYQ